jgi:transcriptional regulator with XRE-family HTH domain
MMSPPSRELVALGRAIRRLRHDRGLSMASLASKAGVYPHHLNRIELAQTNPTFMTLHALSEALGITVWDFMLAARDETAR